MKLGPSLYRIGNDIVAAYLVDDGAGVTVIDAGLSGHWRDLLRELKQMGRGPEDIRGIILTHGDTDHLGFAERLRTQYNVPIYMHEADAARAKGKEKVKGSFGAFRLLPTARFFAYAISKGGFRTKYVTEVHTVKDGDELALPGHPRIIGLPGHSAGSIAIFSPDADAIFVGDALTTRSVLTGAKGPAPAPFTNDPAQALASLRRLAEIHATFVLPGHGAPWTGGVAAAIEKISGAVSAN
jgi:glyoxylase-like metal-dependent hydrolase (beta-lactamase superfamily II)